MTFTLPTVPAPEVRDLLKRDGPQAAALHLLALHPVEITEALEPLDSDERFSVFAALPVNVAAHVLLNADSEFRSDLLERLTPDALARILDRLPVEHAAQILDQLPRERQTQVLAASSSEDAAELDAIRRAPPSSIARLMIRRVPRVRPNMTVADVLRYIRRAHSDLEAIHNLYVLDRDGVLVGVVALSELVVADPQARIGDLMQTRVVMVTPDTDQEEAAHLISRYNFLALPVVDERRRLLGIVTVDDLIDVLIREGTEDVLRLGAVSGGSDAGSDTSYWAGRITSAVKKRLGWLFLLFAAGSLTSLVLSYFQVELRERVALAFFVPLLIGTGGNAGSQTVMTVVRGLALGEIRPRDAARALLRETVTGLLLGLVTGLAAFGLSLGLTRELAVASVVGVAVVAVCAWSTCVGAALPIAARLLRADPAAASAPVIATVVDATGLMIYFSIARWVLGL